MLLTLFSVGACCKKDRIIGVTVFKHTPTDRRIGFHFQEEKLRCPARSNDLGA